MARAFICLARNDIPVESLQISDLKPRSEHSRVGDSSFGVGGQTGYIAHMPQSDDTAAGTPAGVLTVQTTPEYGLAAYLMDNIENSTADAALTVAISNASKDAIIALVAAGSPVTVAAVNNAMRANGVNNAGVTTDLIGTGAENSTGTLEDVLRILAGEVYRVPLGAVSGPAGAFLAARAGAFVTRPNVATPLSVDGVAGDVRGRNPFNTPTVPNNAPVQTGTQDTTFRDIRRILDTGDLHRSAQSGVLSALTPDTYVFHNHGFGYTAAEAAGPPAKTRATDVAGNNIAAVGTTAFQGRAVVVYAADGTVI